MRRNLTIAAAAMALALGCAGTAFAATTVTVKLEDSTVDPSIKGMPMVVDRTSVPAGEVDFDVTNLSKALVHEMLIFPAPPAGQALPYDDAAQKVKEAEGHKLEETDDMAPGLHKTVKITLEPGDYLLICNQPGHYKMGMWSKFTVTK
ncbi:MAG: hypothetical protein KGI57_08555 [Hyphomicrobiales bacterium]|nr:hypothetical protein [Hyphomicrobiales bacterium]MDE2017742.1 hypothetical protein [Hyphomicrobiales bacterium]